MQVDLEKTSGGGARPKKGRLRSDNLTGRKSRWRKRLGGAAEKKQKKVQGHKSRWEEEVYEQKLANFELKTWEIL